MPSLDRLRTPTAFVRLTFVALGLLWVIVPSGAMVRLTASGLGCPDWPLCDGSVVPASAGHQLIEFSNRVVSAVVVAVAILSWLVARRISDGPPALRRWSAAVAVTTAAQLPLGGVTVLTGLHPLAVGAHFLLSMVTLAVVTLLVLSALDWRAGDLRRGWDRRRGPLAGIVALLGGSVLVSGAIVTAAGPHSGDDDVTHRFGDFPAAVEVHVRLAIAFTALAVILIAWVMREGGTDRLTSLMTKIAVPLILLQIIVGEYQYRNGLPWGVVLVHVSIAATLWVVILVACLGIIRPRGGDYGLRDATLWQGTQRTESGSALSRPSGISPPQSTHTP
jgi:cytochrome c oxidase assembly protein subunit 15